MADDEHEQLARQTGMVLRTAVQVAMQVAMQVAEALARRREQNLRTAAAASEARSRALTARLAAEQRSAEAFLRNTSDRQWWATAEDAQIVDAVRVAHTWRNTSPVAERAAVTIEERLRTRKGIDLTSLRDTVSTAAVAATVERELAERVEHELRADQSAQLDQSRFAEHRHTLSGRRRSTPTGTPPNDENTTRLHSRPPASAPKR